MRGKLNGLDLFSGYGGISLALRDYVTPVMYCEIEKYAQGILLSRMDDEVLSFAPVWNDVATLDGTKLRGLVDIIYGGFPCQDISVAGKGAGLEGKRSGLFYEIVRLIKEASPSFVFLENVANIRTKGSIEVSEELASIGYDCRFGCVSAAEIGANHKRDRWFLLAYSKRIGGWPIAGALARTESEPAQLFKEDWQTCSDNFKKSGSDVADTFSIGTQISLNWKQPAVELPRSESETGATSEAWWSSEPDVGRVVNGVAFRVDRIKALGNGVVPLQVRTAFEILMGIAQE